MKERPETGYEEIEQSMFKEKMEEFIQGFKVKKLKKSKKFTPIQDQELVIVEVLWSLVNAVDKELLFHNDIEYFTDFIDTCPQPLLDSYIARLSSGEGLIGNLLTERDARMKSIVDSSIPTSQLCNIKISKGKVAGFIFVINLFDLGGSDKLVKQGYKVENLINFPGH